MIDVEKSSSGLNREYRIKRNHRAFLLWIPLAEMTYSTWDSCLLSSFTWLLQATKEIKFYTNKSDFEIVELVWALLFEQLYSPRIHDEYLTLFVSFC